jgi:hypothetical protein
LRKEEGQKEGKRNLKTERGEKRKIEEGGKGKEAGEGG